VLRRAIIQHLRNEVSTLGGRVYQAFLAPSSVQKPFATVKLVDGGTSARISFAGNHLIEVRLYEDITGSFLTLDDLARSVIAALNGRVVIDSVSGEQYDVYLVPGMFDFVEDDRQLIGLLVRFQGAAIFERG